MKFMLMLIGATVGAVLLMCALGGGLLWYFVIREGAIFGGDDALAARMTAHSMSEAAKRAAKTVSAKIEL